MRIDTHQHFWRYVQQEYPWIDEPMMALRRDCLPNDVLPQMRAAGVTAGIAVQARQSLEETLWLLKLAREHGWIAGVVGWASIASTEFEEQLERLRSEYLLKGLRHVVQEEPPGFLDDQAFNRGIALLQPTALVYELLIRQHQIEEATRFVDRHPKQLFVLDHVGKPGIAKKELTVWRRSLHELARRPQVVCKLSGMVTEADWVSWEEEQLRPYFETVLEAFGPGRLMVGSDWPVVTVACSYARWWEIVSGWLTPLSADEQRQIQAGVAASVYSIPELDGQGEGT